VTLAKLRGSRLLASLLLFASPAAAGSVLPVLHPCPIDAPWLLEHQAHAGHPGHHGMARAPAGDQHEHHCNCIGSCAAATAWLGPRPAWRAVPVAIRLAGAGWTAQDASLLLEPGAALLPPATAPPLG